jgi:hypothetical protein
MADIGIPTDNGRLQITGRSVGMMNVGKLMSARVVTISVRSDTSNCGIEMLFQKKRPATSDATIGVLLQLRLICCGDMLRCASTCRLRALVMFFPKACPCSLISAVGSRKTSRSTLNRGLYQSSLLRLLSHSIHPSMMTRELLCQRESCTA